MQMAMAQKMVGPTTFLTGIGTILIFSLVSLSFRRFEALFDCLDLKISILLSKSQGKDRLHVRIGNIKIVDGKDENAKEALDVLFYFFDRFFSFWRVDS